MATSNSINFKLKRDQLITESYAEIGVGVGGEPLDSDLINAAAIRLNIMIKAWQSYGIKLWKRNEKATDRHENEWDLSFSCNGTSRASKRAGS